MTHRMQRLLQLLLLLPGGEEVPDLLIVDLDVGNPEPQLDVSLALDVRAEVEDLLHGPRDDPWVVRRAHH